MAAKSKRKASSARRSGARTTIAIPASDLVSWVYDVVGRTGRLPASLRGTSLARATDRLVAAGIADHDIVGFPMRDETGIIDMDDNAYRSPLRSVRSTVRFTGERVVTAWLGALVVIESDDTPMTWPPTAKIWKAIAARTRNETAEFRALEILQLAPSPELEIAWKQRDYARWRYTLAIAQNKPLTARRFRP